MDCLAVNCCPDLGVNASAVFIDIKDLPEDNACSAVKLPWIPFSGYRKHQETDHI